MFRGPKYFCIFLTATLIALEIADTVELMTLTYRNSYCVSWKCDSSDKLQ